MSWMMSARCSLTSDCSFANSARVGGAPSSARAACAEGTSASVAANRGQPRRNELLWSMSQAPSVDEQQGGREDVVLDLGDATVLAVAQVLGLEDRAIAEHQPDARGAAP